MTGAPDGTSPRLSRFALRRHFSAPGLDSDTRNATLFMLALGLFVFSDCVFRGRMLYQRDLSVFFTGWMESLVRCVAQGSLPLWNPYPNYGQPLLATAVAQILYPTTWLNLLLPISTYLTFFAVIHLAIAGLGGWAFLRGLGASQRAGMVAGAAWAASGPLLSTVHMTNMYAAAAWLPWAAHFGHRTLGRPSLRQAVLWGASLALMILAGSPELMLMSFGPVLALAGDTALRGSVWRRRLRTTALVALAGSVGVLVSAAQWLPTLAWQRHSMRASLGEKSQEYWSNHPFIVSQAVLPLSLDPLPLTFESRALLFAGREPFLFSIYMGGPLLALVLAGVLAGGRHRVGFLLLGVYATLLSFGPLTPVYDVTRAALPFLRWFRFPAKAIMLAAFAFAVLAGLGFDAWRQRARWSKGVWLCFVALPLLVLGALALYLARPDVPIWRLFVGPPLGGGGYDRFPAFVRMSRHLTLMGVLSLLAGALAAVRALRPGAAPLLAAAVAMVGLGDLVAHTRVINPTVPSALQRYRPRLVGPIASRRPNRTLVMDYGLSQVAKKLHVEGTWPLAPSPVEQYWSIREYPVVIGSGLWGIEGFPADVPGLRDQHAQEAVFALQWGAASPAYCRLARALGVQYVVSLHDQNLRSELRLLATQPVTLLKETGRLWMLPQPLPRAYWVGRTGRGNAIVDLARRVYEDPTFDPRAEVLLPREEADRTPRSAGAAPSGDARIVRLKPDAMEIETNAARSGYLVVTETFAPGWHAKVDGRAVPIVRANGVFRAVRLQAGRHRVTMRYLPTSVLTGAGLSLLGLLAAAAAWLAAPKRAGAN